MASLSIQFWAMPSEMASLLADLFRDEGIFVSEQTSQRGFQQADRSAIEIPPEGGKAFAFTLTPPLLGAASSYEFAERNAGALHLDVGKLTSAGLKESWLSAKTDDEAAIKRWRRAASKLRIGTRAGFVATNPTSGASATYRTGRHTALAREAYAKGLPMLPVAGNAVVSLPMP